MISKGYPGYQDFPVCPAHRQQTRQTRILGLRSEDRSKCLSQCGVGGLWGWRVSGFGLRCVGVWVGGCVEGWGFRCERERERWVGTETSVTLDPHGGFGLGCVGRVGLAFINFAT